MSEEDKKKYTEIWCECPGNPLSPRIYYDENNHIVIRVDENVKIKSVREWHSLTDVNQQKV